MKVINIHQRVIHQPKVKIVELFQTLSSANDKVVATDKWPPLILDNGLRVGSKGGHGPIGYFVQRYDPASSVAFKFTKPAGFNGIHKFEMTASGNNATEIKHTIEMNISGKTILLWMIVIRSLHDAFIEDAFDKIENHFATTKKHSEWSIWVRFLRKILKPGKAKKRRIQEQSKMPPVA